MLLFRKNFSEFNKLKNSLNEVISLTIELHRFFRNFLVYTKKDWNDYLKNFLDYKPPNNYKGFKVYPHKIKPFSFITTKIRNVEEYISSADKSLMDWIYSNENKKLERQIRIIKVDYEEALKQIYSYRNYVLYWAYNPNFEIISRSRVYLIRYDFFKSKCEHYWPPNKMILRNCNIGREWFFNMLKNYPVYSYKDKSISYMWTGALTSTNYIDFVLVKEPTFFNKLFVIENRVEILRYFMDFQNGILRLAKREILKKNGKINKPS